METFKVLIVDDLPESRWLVRLFLRNSPYHLIEASSASEAIMVLKTRDIDLILMDLQMPEVDGYQTTTYLRQQGFRKPIVAFTAHAMHNEIAKCFEVGVDEVLIKPIRKRDLFNTLHTYSKGKIPSSAPSCR